MLLFKLFHHILGWDPDRCNFKSLYFIWEFDAVTFLWTLSWRAFRETHRRRNPHVLLLLGHFLFKFFVHLIHFGLIFNLLFSKVFLEFLLLFFHENSLMFRHSSVENWPIYEDLVIKSLQLVKEPGVFLLHLGYINRISDVLR